MQEPTQEELTEDFLAAKVEAVAEKVAPQPNDRDIAIQIIGLALRRFRDRSDSVETSFVRRLNNQDLDVLTHGIVENAVLLSGIKSAVLR